MNRLIPKYRLGDVVRVDCPDIDCRRIHKGKVTKIGHIDAIHIEIDGKKREQPRLGPLTLDEALSERHSFQYEITYKNGVKRLYPEFYILGLDTIGTMKSGKK